MGLLDDAIREHLELKRRRGADPDEIARLEDEALGDPRSGEFARPAGEEPPTAAGAEPAEEDLPREPPQPAPEEPVAAEPPPPEPEPEPEPASQPWLED